MSFKINKFTPISLLLISVIFLLPRTAFALGISPGVVVATNVINGIQIKRVITVTRANPSHDETLSITAGGEGGKYLQLPTPTLVLPKGQQQTPYTFYIAPVAAPNGPHDAVIHFTEQLPTGPGSSNSLSTLLSITGHVHFVITDQQVRDFSVGSIDTTDSEVGQPLVFTIAITNNGNVDALPEGIDVSLADTTDPKHTLTAHVNGSDLTAVPPLETQTIVVKTTPNPAPTIGTYVGSISVTDAQKEIASKKDATFRVFAPGTLSQSVALDSFTSNVTSVDAGNNIRFDAGMSNTGSGNATVLLNIDLYQGGKIIDTLRTENQVLVRGASGHLSLVYAPKNSGSYDAHAWLEYGVSRTPEKILQFSLAMSKITIAIFIVCAIAALIACIGLVWMYISKHKKHKKHKKR